MDNPVFDAVRTMVAVRDYADLPVPDDVVTNIVEAAHLSASSMNGQPWHFGVARDRDRLRRLADLAKTGPYIPGAALAVVVAAKKDSPFGLSDASRAIQSMMLTAWGDGVGSNWTGLMGIDAVREEFGIPDSYDVLAVVPFGYPKRKIVGKKKRKPFNEVVSSERSGTPPGVNRKGRRAAQTVQRDDAGGEDVDRPGAEQVEERRRRWRGPQVHVVSAGDCVDQADQRRVAEGDPDDPQQVLRMDPQPDDQDQRGGHHASVGDVVLEVGIARKVLREIGLADGAGESSDHVTRRRGRRVHSAAARRNGGVASAAAVVGGSVPAGRRYSHQLTCATSGTAAIQAAKRRPFWARDEHDRAGRSPPATGVFRRGLATTRAGRRLGRRGRCDPKQGAAAQPSIHGLPRVAMAAHSERRQRPIRSLRRDVDRARLEKRPPAHDPRRGRPPAPAAVAPERTQAWLGR
jgi:nitroreductase